MFNNEVPSIEQLQTGRSQRLYDELAFALSRTDMGVLRNWGSRSAGRLVHLGARRVDGLAQTVSGLARFGGREISGFYQALRANRLGSHVGQRTAAAIDSTLAAGSDGGRFLSGVGRALLQDPKGTAPKVLGALLGFNTGSGGLDGNGGIPDLDFLAGIGYHRSPLTHTIIAGIVTEGVFMAVIDLAAVIHTRLPHDHDPLWESLANFGRPFAESASISLSAGIAWHLLVDAGVQPAPYHDLPFSMPIEAHQALFAANGAAEGFDAARRAEQVVVEPIHQDQDKKKRTTGELVVDFLAVKAKQTGDGLKNEYEKWRNR